MVPALFHLTLILSALKKFLRAVGAGVSLLRLPIEYRLKLAGAPFFSPTKTARPSPSVPPPAHIDLRPSTLRRDEACVLGESGVGKSRISEELELCRMRCDSEGVKDGALSRKARRYQSGVVVRATDFVLYSPVLLSLLHEGHHLLSTLNREDPKVLMLRVLVGGLG